MLLTKFGASAESPFLMALLDQAKECFVSNILTYHRKYMIGGESAMELGQCILRQFPASP